MENTVLDALLQFGGTKKIENELTVPKLFFASCSVLFLLAAFHQLKKNPLVAIVYLFSTHDCLRAAYNCYTKKYFSKAAAKLSSSPGTMVNAILNWAQRAVGALVTDDPLKNLKNKVDWTLIWEDTYIRYLVLEGTKYTVNRK